MSCVCVCVCVQVLDLLGEISMESKAQLEAAVKDQQDREGAAGEGEDKIKAGKDSTGAKAAAR